MRINIPFPKGGMWKILRFYAYFRISNLTTHVECLIWESILKCLYQLSVINFILDNYAFCFYVSHANPSGLFHIAVYTHSNICYTHNYVYRKILEVFLLLLMMETISIYYNGKMFIVGITYIKTRLSIFPLPKNHSSYISVPKFHE